MKKEEYNKIVEEVASADRDFLPFVIDSDVYILNGYNSAVLYINTMQGDEYMFKLDPLRVGDILKSFSLSLLKGSLKIDSQIITYEDIYKVFNITLLDMLEKNGIQEKDLLEYSEVAQ